MCVIWACTCDQLKLTLHVAARVLCASPALSAKAHVQCDVFLLRGILC